MFGNLIRNAREAMPQGGGSRSRPPAIGDSVEVAVADTGVGIAPKTWPDHGPLYSTKARGLGLGLAIARSILEKNQGGLHLATSEPGEGARSRSGWRRLSTEGARSHDNTRTPSILVVDDDVDTCRNLCDILTDLGYQVDTAHDGPAALELVQRNAYDVALLDLKMPGMDGLDALPRDQGCSAGTVAIVVTAYAERTDRRRRSPPGPGRSSPSRSISPGSWGWSTRPSASRWSWSSTTTTTCAPTSGTCFRERGYPRLPGARRR